MIKRNGQTIVGNYPTASNYIDDTQARTDMMYSSSKVNSDFVKNSRVPIFCNEEKRDSVFFNNPTENGIFHYSLTSGGDIGLGKHAEIIVICESKKWSQCEIAITSEGYIYKRHRNNNGTENSSQWTSWELINGYPLDVSSSFTSCNDNVQIFELKARKENRFVTVSMRFKVVGAIQSYTSLINVAEVARPCELVNFTCINFNSQKSCALFYNPDDYTISTRNALTADTTEYTYIFDISYFTA